MTKLEFIGELIKTNGVAESLDGSYEFNHLVFCSECEFKLECGILFKSSLIELHKNSDLLQLVQEKYPEEFL